MNKGYFDDCMNEEQLKARFRELCVKMHPDKNTDNPNATADFQEMQQQYEERKAELAGDYSKARKGRERRERENRERAERERKERERMKVAMVVEQARLNRQKSHMELKAGDYIYAMGVDYHHFDTYNMSGEDILKAVMQEGVKPECVVKIELIVDCMAYDMLNVNPSKLMPEGIFGGWEVIQSADPAAGVKKAKRVAKVIMFRSEQYCYFGNPQGDMTIDDFYMPVNYAAMWDSHLDRIKARLAYEQQEAARIEAERKAKLLAEIKPLMEEWGPKLIELSVGLTPREQLEVAMDNLKTMLKGKFPGTTFKVKRDKYVTVYHTLQWEDGPTVEEVEQVLNLFDHYRHADKEITPWMERYGNIRIADVERKIGTLTKAKILQQLGQISESFRSRGVEDEVVLDDMDWMMLHLMVGVDINSDNAKLCMKRMDADGKRYVKVLAAISFIFRNTSYKKTTKAAKKKAA